MRTIAGLVAGSSILLGSALVGGQAAPTPSPARPAVVATGSTVSAAVKLAALPAAGAVPSHFEPASVSFVTTSLGFVLGTSPCTRAPCTDLVSTSDGGRHWVELSAPRAALAVSAGGVPATGQRAVSKVVFANASDGVAYGPGLWSTTDGAATWSQVHIGRPVLTLAASGGFAEAVVESCDPSSARCSAPALHLERAAIGSGASVLYRSTNGGHTWSAVPISASPPAPVGQPSTAARIGPHAVWRDALRGQAAAAEACIFSRRPTPSSAQVKSCIARYMRAHGASTAAVAYFEATGSYLISFVDTGRIDVGYTLSEEPMDCGCFGYVLLNGAHQYLVLPAPSLASPAYAKLRRAYRLPSGHTGLSYLYFPPFLESARKRAGGGEDLIFQFVLNDVCNACATPYRARAAYLFSSAGALVGSVSLGPCLGPQPKGSAAGKVDVKEPACPPTRAGPPR